MAHAKVVKDPGALKRWQKGSFFFFFFVGVIEREVVLFFGVV